MKELITAKKILIIVLAAFCIISFGCKNETSITGPLNAKKVKEIAISKVKKGESIDEIKISYSKNYYWVVAFFKGKKVKAKLVIDDKDGSFVTDEEVLKKIAKAQFYVNYFDSENEARSRSSIRRDS